MGWLPAILFGLNMNAGGIVLQHGPLIVGPGAVYSSGGIDGKVYESGGSVGKVWDARSTIGSVVPS